LKHSKKTSNPGWEAGEYWIVCDRCGENRRKSDIRKTWDNLLVCYPECWEPRQPQDFVKAKVDFQAVPEARPERNTVLRETTLSSAGSKDDTTVELADVTYVADESSIGIALDTGETQWTLVDGDLVGSVATIFNPLYGDAASGNVVYINAAAGDTFIEAGSVTGDDL